MLFLATWKNSTQKNGGDILAKAISSAVAAARFEALRDAAEHKTANLDETLQKLIEVSKIDDALAKGVLAGKGDITIGSAPIVFSFVIEEESPIVSRVHEMLVADETVRGFNPALFDAASRAFSEHPPSLISIKANQKYLTPE